MKMRVSLFWFFQVFSIFCFCSLSFFVRSALTAEVYASTEVPAPKSVLVPEEIARLFDQGMPAKDFARMSNHLPKALEGFLEGSTLVIIELKDPPVARYKITQKDRGDGVTLDALQAYQQNLEQTQSLLSQAMQQMGVAILSNYTTVYNGILARVPYMRLQEVRTMSGVRAVHPAPIHKPMLQASVPLMRANHVWEGVDGVDGQGMVIAIIDTGVDYTHIAFGGSGDPQDYADIDPGMHVPWAFPTAKVIGGYDFAGSLYDAGCTQEHESSGVCSSTPTPDSNPLDEHGHGTHVAAIAAGLVTHATDPGVAPGADLMALKIFGRSGSTALTIDALEWAALHYGHYGYPHVINMSLGSNFGTDNDPSVVAANNAADLGIVVVASAGNSGNVHYITGTPASGSKVISVAATTTGYITGPTVSTAGLASIIYNPGGFDNNTGSFDSPITAPLEYVGSLDGADNNELCSTTGIAADALSGKVALIRRGTCTFSLKIHNASSLGAVAALIYNNADGRFGMVGEPVNIPAGSIAGQDGILLVTKDGQSVTVSAQDDLNTIDDPYSEPDQIGSFSSRGPRGTDSKLKPEVSAPGVGISAAAMGTGTGKVSMSGTSMAAPHVSGLAALLIEDKPGWNSEEIKALMMNAVVELADNAPIPRSGSGRVDAVQAIDGDIVVVGDDSLMGLNWGVIMSSSNAVELEKQVTIHNKGQSGITFGVAAFEHPASLVAGQVLDVTPAEVTIAAESSQTVTVALTLDMTETPSSFNVLEEYSGWITFTPQGGGDVLRLPYYYQPKPFAVINLQERKGIVDPVMDQAEVRINRYGPVASNLRFLPALNHNPLPDSSMAGPGDVRLFGLDHQGWVHGSYGDMLEIGINTWDYWHVPQPQFAEFNLYVDSDQNGSFDYVLFNYNLGWFQGAGHNNFWIVIQVDLATGMLYLGSPFLIYSDYNAAYMEWWVPASWMDLGEGSSSFDYQLFSFDPGFQGNPGGSFDYKKSPMSWTINNSTPGPGNATTTAWIGISDQDGYDYSRPLGAMLVDYRGNPGNTQGAQAYFIPLERRIIDDAKTSLSSVGLQRNEPLYFNVGFSLEGYTVQAYRKGHSSPLSGVLAQVGGARYVFQSDSPGSYEIRVRSTSGSTTTLGITVSPSSLPGVLMLLLDDEE